VLLLLLLITLNMQAGKNATPTVQQAPTYNELLTLVESLRQEVASMRVASSETANSDRIKRESHQPVMDFRVLPDLDKTVGTFDGRESTHASADWLASVEGIAYSNCWSFTYRIQFVRANVQGAAHDWFFGRLFVDSSDFKCPFVGTLYVRDVN